MGNPRFAHRALVLSLAGWVLVTGCTSASPNPATINSSGSLSKKLAEAYCAREAACCTSASAATDAGAGPDGGPTVPCPATDGDAGTAKCLDHAQLAADQQLALIGTAYAEGLIAISSAVVAACVDAYKNRACDPAVNIDQALSDSAC